jgi:hypothetical protein
MICSQEPFKLQLPLWQKFLLGFYPLLLEVVFWHRCYFGNLKSILAFTLKLSGIFLVCKLVMVSLLFLVK